MTIKNILISVWDKKNLDIILSLFNKDVTILSSGGTYHYLKSYSDIFKLIKIEDYTGHEEILGGRVKTLDYKIYTSLLLKDRNENKSLIQKLGIIPIDLVIVNLYPFKDFVLSNQECSQDDLIEMIDIGGVSLLRAAAKNFQYVVSLPSLKFYDLFISEYKKNGFLSQEIRYQLAIETFKITSEYDEFISKVFFEKKSIYKSK